ncbi:MAG: tRNA (adenosine(37)-N6)-dimethylallyltransferase MiaA [Roseovarius sp.]
MDRLISQIDAAKPVLIAGPTASGKSELAVRIAEAQGGVVVNADAIQVYDNWRVLTARPSVADEARAPHRLFGHIARTQEYSVGHWLREVAQVQQTGARLIIVGGTGLYLTALTEGLADIPATPPELRVKADARRAAGQLADMLDDLDAATRARIDTQNPMRVQRAWEVQHATGRGLADWQDTTPPPQMPLGAVTPLVLEADKAWLTPRIAQRFDRMMDMGALDEARANLANWDPALPASKAIGAPELIAYLRDEITKDAAREAATIATRQFAKRQRTWFRARMKHWQQVPADTL